MRNARARSRARLTLPFRISHSALLILVAACNPRTTRPAFAPLPEALRVVINAPPARVTAFADSLLRADTIEAVYRPREDPSRTMRDLERASPPGSAGEQRAQLLLAALKEKLGITTY